jgi:shikimate kinase
MSGTGKSTWAARLAERGFRCFCCDEMITAKLSPELVRPDGKAMTVGEWMGFPYEPHYKERESAYLACEMEVLDEICAYLSDAKSKPEENIVVDTTGSVIYVGEETLRKLRRHTVVVHLATPPEVWEHMLKAYVANQRPVLWRGLFSQEPNESMEEALARCYPRLLSAREQLYERCAHVIVDYYTRQGSFGVDDLLEIVHRNSGRAWPSAQL